MGKEFWRPQVILPQTAWVGGVILYDPFEELFQWSGTGSGLGFVVEKDATVCYNNAGSLHLKSREIGPGINDYVKASRVTHERPSRRYAMEFFWKITALGWTKNVHIETMGYEPSATLYPQIRWDVVGAKWQVLTGFTAWTDIPGGAQSLDQGAWHHFRYVFNLGTRKIESMSSDELELPDLNLDFHLTPLGGAKRLQLAFRAYTIGLHYVEAHFDDVLLVAI